MALMPHDMPGDFADDKKSKRGRGRPQHEPTEEMRNRARSLAGVGISVDDIAFELGISKQTLYGYYREEIKHGAIRAVATVARSLYEAATHPTEPNITAQIFFLKCRAAWKETMVHEHVNPDLASLTDAEIEKRIAQIEAKRNRVRASRVALHERVQERPADILH